MLQLANAELTVHLLDPRADHARLGPRFGWGGFIWQVHDHHAGALLAGPEWPDPNPAPHNAQGAPESFRHSTTTGEPLLWRGSDGLAPGVGALQRDAAGAITVREPCAWQIDATPRRIVFRTCQDTGNGSYALEREIAIEGRQLRSRSRLTNRGAAALKLEWFAHPFFALQSDGKLQLTLHAGTTLPENMGYDLAGTNLTMRRPFAGQHDGCLVLLGLPPREPLRAILSHPTLAWVRFATDFIPSKTVLWANGHTLSLEPFLVLDLAPGDSREFALTYEFGPTRT